MKKENVRLFITVEEQSGKITDFFDKPDFNQKTDEYYFNKPYFMHNKEEGYLVVLMYFDFNFYENNKNRCEEMLIDAWGKELNRIEKVKNIKL